MRMKLIDRDAVVAEIDSMLKSVEHTSHCDEISFNSGRWKALTSIKDFLDTFEVKEVDLEKEYEEFVVDDPILGNFITNDTMGMMVAKHFFELGLKTKRK